MNYVEAHFVELLLAALTVAFTAWAGFLWRIGNKTVKLLYEMKDLLSGIKIELRHLETQFDKHDQKPWHEKAGLELATLRTKVEELERDNHG